MINTPTDAPNIKLNSMLEQVLELFYTYGLKNINMDEISHRLGISKKTLYCHVKNKEDLIDKVFDYEITQWNVKVETILAEPVNAIEKLLKISMKVHTDIQQFNPILKYELKKYYAAPFDRYIEKKVGFIHSGMIRNMEQGIAEGLYRPNLDIELVAKIYLGSFIEMHNTEICKFDNITFEEVLSVMFENHIRAISTPKGLQYFESRIKDINTSPII